MNIKEIHKLFLNASCVCTDTRNITENCIFFALKGDNFNGNLFAKEALKNGAKFAVIDEKQYKEDERYIMVKDTLKTLQQLAKFHRIYLEVPIIALTGSNGKTTTKELINSVLKTQYKTVATQGNFNNHIGVPLTLLSMNKSTEIGVVEMGANHQKEIEFLCSIALPDYGYITNFGKAHLEGFGGVEGIVKGKSELYVHLKENNKTIFVNGNDKKQREVINNYKKVISYGGENSSLNVSLLKSHPFVELKFENTIVSSQLIGSYNFTNICAAVLIGKHFNISNELIKQAVERYTPENNRSQLILKENKKIILDAYNANPTSMRAALEYFSELNDSKKIAILGDMFELGDSSVMEHQNIIKLACELKIDTIFCIGENFYNSKAPLNNVTFFESVKDFKNAIIPEVFNDKAILIKGSRGMALEQLLDWI